MPLPDILGTNVAAAALPAWTCVGGGAALGAIIGSFLATLVIRWPAGESLAGRSRCDHCGATVGAAALVPLVSFALLRGRCRACGGAIDRRHPAIEACAAAIGAGALWLAPGIEGLAGALFGWLLLTLAVLDLEHFWLPDRLTAAVAATGLAGGAIGLAPPLPDRLIGGIAGYAALAAIGWGYRHARGRVGLGGGDPKLLGGIGLWLGWAALPFVLLLASLGGIAAVLALRLAGRRVTSGDRVPFGPLLAGAAWALWCVVSAGIAVWPY